MHIEKLKVMPRVVYTLSLIIWQIASIISFKLSSSNQS